VKTKPENVKTITHMLIRIANCGKHEISMAQVKFNLSQVATFKMRKRKQRKTIQLPRSAVPNTDSITLNNINKRYL